jgi:pyruvate/2-oxoglutarate dehydrogenase complex dihydrolipoamide acyltransferase (E2) component
MENRPAAVADETVTPPRRYAPPSNDHRLGDGRDALTFLLRDKERIEDPDRMLLDV